VTQRSGAVALVGRPNAGKSTLLNRWVGEKVSIVSDRPQTTRHRIIGVRSEDRGQIVFYDTPGVHRPLHRLNRRMMDAAQDAARDADALCLLVDAAESFGKGDAFTLDWVKSLEVPRILLLNKVDRVKKPELLPRIARYADSGAFLHIVPVSAAEGEGCDRALGLLYELMPEGSPLRDPEVVTPHPERFLAAEIVREKLLRRTRDELPHATAVWIERWEESERLVRLHATILVERAGQKAIVIGARGENLKNVGTAARHELETQLGKKVHLELFVRLEEDWRNDEATLGRLEREASPLGEVGGGERDEFPSGDDSEDDGAAERD
jgi:GTP-binding protein Era